MTVSVLHKTVARQYRLMGRSGAAALNGSTESYVFGKGASSVKTIISEVQWIKEFGRL
jgi:hypothetical protein